MAVLSTSTRRWSQRGREVLLGKQDLPKSTMHAKRAAATSSYLGLLATAFVFMAIAAIVYTRYPRGKAIRKDRPPVEGP